ncbi:MAG TPA: glycosyltransferase [Polaromonas sp.]|jgi:glycogenin glucosyltransferase|nr:glycosyltransferase [Polaromonas sp.]
MLRCSGQIDSRITPFEEARTMRAYVTLLSTESYLPGVLALHESIRRSGTRHPFVAAVSAHLPPQIDSLLEKAGILVRRIPESTAIPREMIEGNGHWGHTFDKVHLFGLHEFSKLVYVDSDMIVLVNMDELFDKPHMSAVAAGRLVHPHWVRFNAGLLVIEPVQGLSDRIFSKLPQAVADVAGLVDQSDLGDQDLLNAYYPGWTTRADLELDQGYNMFACYLDLHIEKHGYRLPDQPRAGGPLVKIVHFVGPRKPWMRGASLRHYARVLREGKAVKWENRMFSVYKKLIKDGAVATA